MNRDNEGFEKISQQSPDMIWTEDDKPEVKSAQSMWKDFAPWHKPRKQWVRRYQWITQLQKLIKQRAVGQGAVSYLGLPGRELFDIRLIAECCRDNNLGFRYFGVSPESDNTIANIARSQINDIKTVEEQSSLLQLDRFELMANEKSVLWKRAKNHAPFDVINLDLCNSVWQPHTMNALRKTIELQTVLQPRSWIFCLTQRTDLQSLGVDAVKSFASVIASNSADRKFSEKLVEQMGGNLAAEASNAEGWHLISPEFLPQLVSLGVGKWFIQFLEYEKNMPKVELASAAYYRVYTSDHPDMVSLVFRIGERQIVKPDQGNVLDERTEGIRVLRRINSILDVDRILQNDDAIAHICFNEQRQLLQDVGADVVQWDSWVNKSSN